MRSVNINPSQTHIVAAAHHRPVYLIWINIDSISVDRWNYPHVYVVLRKLHRLLAHYSWGSQAWTVAVALLVQCKHILLLFVCAQSLCVITALFTGGCLLTCDLPWNTHWFEVALGRTVFQPRHLILIQSRFRSPSQFRRFILRRLHLKNDCVTATVGSVVAQPVPECIALQGWTVFPIDYGETMRRPMLDYHAEELTWETRGVNPL